MISADRVRRRVRRERELILNDSLLPPSRIVRSIRVSGCSLRTFDHALCNVNHRDGRTPLSCLFRTIRAFPRTLHAAEWSSCFFSLRRLLGRLVQKRIRRKFTFSVNSKQPGGAARSRQEENTRTRRDDDAAGCLFYSASIARALHGHAKRFGFRIAGREKGSRQSDERARFLDTISHHSTDTSARCESEIKKNRVSYFAPMPRR